MIRILRNIHARTLRSYDIGLDIILIAALCVMTIGMTLIVGCPQFDSCMNKLIQWANLPGGQA